jgi:Rieske Fe-S protein
MSAVMSFTNRGWLVIATVAMVGAGAQLSPATALADPDSGSQTEVAPAGDGLQHNVTYRARADGTSRGAVVAYKIDDANVNSEQPTLLPGSTFEVNTVLADPKQAGMELSIQWPYGSNLHCEILVDDQVVAQADQFIAPRLLHPKNDPLYGVLQCGAPLDTPIVSETAPSADPAAAAPAPPAEAPPPPAA